MPTAFDTRNGSCYSLSFVLIAASVLVRAAKAIFNHAAKAIEIEDIEARVAALEAAAVNAVIRRIRRPVDQIQACIQPDFLHSSRGQKTDSPATIRLAASIPGTKE